MGLYLCIVPTAPHRPLGGVQFDTLLDVGCGDGKVVHEIKKHYKNKEIYGIDFSRRAVALAQYFNPDCNIVAGDITKSNENLPTSFDVITLIEVLEHIPPAEIDVFLQAIHRKLHKNGYFIITVPSNNLPVNKKHYQHFSKKILSDTLKEYFILEKIYFLNTISFSQKCIEKLLSNRVYILNNSTMRNRIYHYYLKKLLPSTEEKCMRLCVVCRKK